MPQNLRYAPCYSMSIRMVKGRGEGTGYIVTQSINKYYSPVAQTNDDMDVVRQTPW